MKVMVFDVGGTEIKYSVMDEQMNRFDSSASSIRTVINRQPLSFSKLVKRIFVF